MRIPILADKTHKISSDYGVLKEDEGIAFRGLFIIDPKGNFKLFQEIKLFLRYSPADYYK